MSNDAQIARLGGSRQLRHLSQAVILEELGPPRLVRAMLLLITLSIFGVFGWMSVTSLKETTKANGEVVPSSSVMTIQHLEGGIVSEILVHEGDLVEQGDVLVRMDPTSAHAQLDELQAQAAALEVRAERLRAFGEGRALRQDRIDPRFSELAREEMTIYRQQAEALADERNVLQHQAEQRMQELRVLRSQEEKLKRRAGTLGEQKRMHETLVKRGLVSKFVYLQSVEQYDSAVGELAEVRGKIVRAQSAIEEARGKISQLGSKRRNDALTEAGKVVGELTRIREAIVRAQDRVKRLEVRAPVDGIVKGLTVHTLGGVVNPGGLITEIVPTEGNLIVEARVSPTDIGHVSTGQKATVKVTTFDFARFGAIDGRVTKISATTFKDREDEIYYRAEITLDKNYAGNRPGENLVLPGMLAEININTGERTVLRYLLRPIFDSLDSAFTER